MSRCTKKNCPMVGVSADCDLKDCLYRTEADQSKDTIYREDVIKEIHSAWKSLYKPKEWDDYDIEHNIGFCGGLITAINIIKALPSADRPQEWIPCSESLPSENGDYLRSME